MGITYLNSLSPSPSHLKAGISSDWASFLDSCSSLAGLAITFAGDLTHWRSKEKLTRPLPSAEVILIAASPAAWDLKWLRQLAHECRIPIRPPSEQAFPFRLSLDQSKDSPLPINMQNHAAIVIEKAQGPTTSPKIINLHRHFLVAQVLWQQAQAPMHCNHQTKADFLTAVLTKQKYKSNLALTKSRHST